MTVAEAVAVHATDLTDLFRPPAVRDSASGHIELVIFRSLIEHQMLGITMGKGCDELGNTLRGKTELSCLVR